MIPLDSRALIIALICTACLLFTACLVVGVLAWLRARPEPTLTRAVRVWLRAAPHLEGDSAVVWPDGAWCDSMNRTGAGGISELLRATRVPRLTLMLFPGEYRCHAAVAEPGRKGVTSGVEGDGTALQVELLPVKCHEEAELVWLNGAEVTGGDLLRVTSRFGSAVVTHVPAPMQPGAAPVLSAATPTAGLPARTA